MLALCIARLCAVNTHFRGSCAFVKVISQFLVGFAYPHTYLFYLAQGRWHKAWPALRVFVVPPPPEPNMIGHVAPTALSRRSSHGRAQSYVSGITLPSGMLRS